MVSREALLNVLPPIKNTEIILKHDQEVSEIMQEVLDAHRVYTSDYDLIAEYFYDPNPLVIIESLYDFCKKYIRYKVESEDDQTTRSPALLLALAKGDCKHYAGFIGGVLDAINRLYGEKIKWWYRFASYDYTDRTPQHVFVVARIDGREYWIDPVLPKFNQRLLPAFPPEDHKPEKMLKRLSGAPQPSYPQYLSGNKNAVGVALPWGDIASTAISVVTNIFGGDAVPNYPVKETKTFNSLKASLLNDWVGTVAPGGNFEVVPRSIEEAKSMLAKAQKRKAEEIALGHGYGDGPGWDTLQMLYDETIRALQIFIGAVDQIQTTGTPSIPDLTADYPNTQQPTTASKSNMLMWVAAAGLGVYLLTKKKRRVNGMEKAILPVVLIGGIAYFALTMGNNNGLSNQERAYLKNLENLPVWDQMSNEEIHDAYTFLKGYNGNRSLLPADLELRIQAIGSKYNIFT